MNRNLLWRGAFILGLTALIGFQAWPPQERIRLGLDLRGGMYLVLQVEVADALKADRDKVIDRLVSEAQEEGISAVASEATGDTSFALLGVSPDRDETIRAVVDEYLGADTWTWSREGDRLQFAMTDRAVENLSDMAVRQAEQTIRNRVDAFGVAEPVINRQGFGGNRVVVQLPGVDDPERVKDLIKSTAFLEFRLVDYPEGGRSGATEEEVLAHYGGQPPADIEILTEDIWDQSGQLAGRRYYGVNARSVITGRDLKSARPGQGQFNQPIVQFQLTHEGGKIFGDVTGANVGRGLAIILDGKVRSAPRLNSRISDSGIIEGSFTLSEVEDLAMVLQSGALPAGITYLEERTVGPSLGADSIAKGLRAGLVGMGLVVAFMLIVYKLTGINAVIALSLNLVLLFGALSSFGATLTLPGIAGIILTLGMAVDANVLVFERIREELRIGRTVKSAIANGFEKAMSSIFDSNLTTLLSAMFLYNFGTGPIRGFAVTLSIGIFASVFTAVVVSRWLFDVLLARREAAAKASGRTIESLSI